MCKRSQYLCGTAAWETKIKGGGETFCPEMHKCKQKANLNFKDAHPSEIFTAQYPCFQLMAKEKPQCNPPSIWNNPKAKIRLMTNTIICTSI